MLPSERHVATLTEVMTELATLKPRLTGRYFAGMEEGIREAMRTVEKMRLEALKSTFTKDCPFEPHSNKETING